MEIKVSPYKETVDEVLSQNRLILESNLKTLDLLTVPIFTATTIIRDDSDMSPGAAKVAIPEVNDVPLNRYAITYSLDGVLGDEVVPANTFDEALAQFNESVTGAEVRRIRKEVNDA